MVSTLDICRSCGDCLITFPRSLSRICPPHFLTIPPMAVQGLTVAKEVVAMEAGLGPGSHQGSGKQTVIL